MADITEVFLGTMIGLPTHEYWIPVKLMPDDPTDMPVRIFALWDRDNPISPFLGMRVWCGPAHVPSPSNYVHIFGIVVVEPSYLQRF